MSVTGSTSDAARKGRQGKKALGCFGGVFILFGLGFSAVFLWPVVRIIEAQNWRETPCTILDSGVQSHGGGKGGPTYSIEVRYEYLVDDQRHVSTRYKFMTGSSSGYEGKAEVVRRLRPGTQTVCYVDKRNPSEAVIERGFTADLLFGLIPLLFVGIGAAVLFGAFVYKGKPKPTAGSADPQPPTAGGRPATLKASASPAGRLGCALVFALFWNGLVSLFVGSTITDWSRGKGDGCATAFLIPFVLVGAGLIVLSIYFFLALFNPRPLIRVSSAAAALGDTVEIEWETTGNVDRIKVFTITLQGREEATYRRGTSTRTDKATFLTLTLVSLTRGRDARRGKAKVQIPPDTMHSFKSANNRFLWSFHVTGDIPRWPDIKEEFAFEVLPRRPGGPS
ncbi:MAG: DUF3592 domain-containing protein [Planctomycetes bacterium]|nr:DUF3592 domain-containing protein [Planctomycetota bacterium]